MQTRSTRKPAHMTRPLRAAVSGLFFAVLSGQRNDDPLPEPDANDPDVLTDGTRGLIIGELYLQNWR
jgi:hypothetical protein